MKNDMVLGFEQILLQAAAGTTSETVANSITALITSIGSLAVTVGTVIGLVITFLKARDASGTARDAGSLAARAEEIGIKVGQYATAFGQKTIENKENIRTITQVGLALSPQATQVDIAKKQALIEALQKQIDADNAQLSRLKGAIPGADNAQLAKFNRQIEYPSADADTIKDSDLPRPKPEELDLDRAIKSIQ
jgi:hypothetical protein